MLGRPVAWYGVLFSLGFLVGYYLTKFQVQRMLREGDAGKYTDRLLWLTILGTAQKAAVVLVASGLLIGYFKGRFVLRKTAMRTIDQIQTLPNPSSLGKLYGIGSYILLAAMIAVGITLRSIGAAEEVRAPSSPPSARPSYKGARPSSAPRPHSRQPSQSLDQLAT